MELTCPKCQGTMRSYERNGVHVDQCTDCRGIFLDRGELERLVDAENGWHAAASRPVAPGPAGAPASAGPPPSGGLGGLVGEALQQVARRQSGGYGHSGHPHKKRKKSFLDELFG